jgi:probable F420-dependent oxidoreductase
MSAAEVTTIRLGTFVLNAGFYKPALLARDAAAVDLLSDGRLELGLGAGYVREEFEAAELPFPSAGRRVEHVDHVTAYLRHHLPSVPVLIAGAGDRLLTVAARRADIIGIAGGKPGGSAADPIAERVAFVRRAAGDRFAELELNLAVTAVPRDGSGVPDLSLTRRYAPDLSEEQLLRLPGVLAGSPREIADTLRRYRDTYGLTYFTVQEHHAEGFSKVIEQLR